MLHVILVGPPGGGKGTQAKRISNHYNIPHISTGDIIRKMIKTNSEISEDLKFYIKNGKLVPDDLMIKMLRKRFKENDCNKKGFLLDGFPRTLNQAKSLEEIFINLKITLHSVIHIKVPNKELIKRLVKRSKLENRIDDTIEIIKHRIDIYYKHINPILKLYEQKNKLKHINGIGEIDDITKSIFSILNKSM